MWLLCFDVESSTPPALAAPAFPFQIYQKPGLSMAWTQESTMSMNKKSTLILSMAFTLRIILFNIPSIADTLATRVEVVTPITSFKRCECSKDKRWSTFWRIMSWRARETLTNTSLCPALIVTEGLYLYQNSVPPYDNGIFHQVGNMRCTDKGISRCTEYVRTRLRFC